MLQRAFTDKIGTSPKTAVSSIVLLANAFVWYFYATRFLTDTLSSGGFVGSSLLVVWGANLLGLAASALFGVFIVYRFKKRVAFLRYWLLAGIFVSLLPLAVDISVFNFMVLFAAIVGVYFGLGVPTAFGYFAASTKAKNRSRLGGITFIVIFGVIFLLRSFGITDVAVNTLILAACQAIGFVIIFFVKPDEKAIAASDQVSYRFIFTNKSFLLYFIPWIMFSVVNYLVAPVAGKIFPTDFVQFYTMIENVLAAVFTVVFGFVGDYLGRKRLVVAGFVLMGLGYASLGLFQNSLFGWWFYTAVDGVAWGVFYAIFFMTIWGDVAHKKSSEKYYVLGSLPFLALVFMQLSLGSYVASTVNEGAVFSFASLFLFLAVLPLVYAPETLPDKIIKERELKSYIEKAQHARLRSDSEK